MNAGIQCSYVRVVNAIDPTQNKEPVHEIKLDSKDARYRVDQLSHDEHSLYWRRGDMIGECPWVNVNYCRPLLEST